MTALAPGMKVVCVDNESSPKYGKRHPSMYLRDIGGLVKGRIYTIREIYLDPVEGALIRLVGILRGSEDYGFSPQRFRPLDNDTGFDFREMLTKAPREREVA